MVVSIQNNNPGNLREVGKTQGFRKFSTPQEGVAAMRDDLLAKVEGRSSAMKMNYGENYQPTLRNVISTWAPSSENNTGNYVSFVARNARINPDKPLSAADVDKIMPAMIEMEGGRDASTYFGRYQTADSGEIMNDAAPEGETFTVVLPDGTEVEGIPVGTTKEQIRAKLEPQGYKFDDAPKEEVPQEPVNVQNEPQSVGRTALDQSLQGATFNTADEAMDAIAALGAGAYMKAFRPELMEGQTLDSLHTEARKMSQDRLRQQVEQNPGTSIAANIGGAVLTGGAGATTKTGTALANSLRAGNTASRVVKAGVAGAPVAAAYRAGGAEDGKALEAASDVSALDFAGAAVPAIAATGRAVKSTVVPKISKETAALAQKARDMGIPLRLDQISPTRVRKTVQKVSQELPFSGADAFEEKQRRAWNKAVAKTIGQDAEDLSPATVVNFLNDSSTKFNSIMTGQRVNFSAAAKQKLDAIVAEAEDSLTGDVANIVKRNVDKLGQDIAAGTVSGDKIASFRSTLLKRIPKADSGAKAYLSDLVGVIDDVVGAGLPKNKADMLAQARREWRNFKTMEPLLEEAENGLINPTKLLNRVKASPYIKASRNATGSDDLIDLARIGKQFLPKAGGSDTFQKAALGGGSGALAITAVSNPLLALGIGTKAAAGLAANRGVQAANSSQALVNLAVKTSQNQARRLSKPRIVHPVATGNIANEQGPTRAALQRRK